MTICMTPAGAAARPRILSPLGSPSTLSTVVAAWRVGVTTLGVPAGMRDESVFDQTHPTHNSIPAAITTVVPTANVPTDAYGAAKQAAPPRGVPR